MQMKMSSIPGKTIPIASPAMASAFFVCPWSGSTSCFFKRTQANL
jgi:hypothetical protein